MKCGGRSHFHESPSLRYRYSIHRSQGQACKETLSRVEVESLIMIDVAENRLKIVLGI